MLLAWIVHYHHKPAEAGFFSSITRGNRMTPQHAETAASIAEKSQYVGSGATVIFGLALSEWGVLVGMAVALGGFLLTWYYKHKAFLLREEEHRANMHSRNRRSTDVKYFRPSDYSDE